MNPDIVIYAGNPHFESLKMDPAMEALRDRTFPQIDLSALFGCMESEAEEELKKRQRRRRLKYRSIDDKFEVSVD